MRLITTAEVIDELIEIAKEVVKELGYYIKITDWNRHEQSPTLVDFPLYLRAHLFGNMCMLHSKIFFRRAFLFVNKRYYHFPSFENHPSRIIIALDTLVLGPSPLATATATFSPTASDISATSLCVNPGQRRTE